MRLAMIKLNKAINEKKFNTKMLLQIHDELIFETPNDEIAKIIPIIEKVMTSLSESDFHKFSIPLTVDINLEYKKEKILFNCDSEQISRVFFNLIKNSIESIQEKHFKNSNFTKKIHIAIINKSDYIEFIITDNGTGFSEKNLKNILKPYFTTKPKGSGLGLSIVSKIINDHEGTIKFAQQKVGARIIVKFPKNVD